MKRTLILAAVLLTGCASPTWLQNRAVCTVDGKQVHVLSQWGPLGIGSKLAAADAAVICRR